VTLNDLQRRNSPYLSYFIEFGSFGSRLRLKIDLMSARKM